MRDFLIRLGVDSSDILIEDCMIERFENNVLMQIADQQYGRLSNIRIRRSVIVDAFCTAGHSQGIMAGETDGLLLEVHPDPDHALSDGAQTLNFAGFEKLLESLKRLAEPLGRVIN